MQAGVLGDLRRFGLDMLIGLGIFSLLALFLLGGEAPRNLPQVGHVLSIDANAADYHFEGPFVKAAVSDARDDAKPFRFSHGWTALSVMAAMFAMLYAFNLALFRRFTQRHALARRRRL